jgi:hypothetical protein
MVKIIEIMETDQVGTVQSDKINFNSKVESIEVNPNHEA